jgi:hypothetical protein
VTVRRKDGGVFTIGDVVKQRSPYFLANQSDILKAKAPFLNTSLEDLPEKTRIFFDGVFGIITPHKLHLGIELWIEGEDGESVEQHFKCATSQPGIP